MNKPEQHLAVAVDTLVSENSQHSGVFGALSILNVDLINAFDLDGPLPITFLEIKEWATQKRLMDFIAKIMQTLDTLGAMLYEARNNQDSPREYSPTR